MFFSFSLTRFERFVISFDSAMRHEMKVIVVDTPPDTPPKPTVWKDIVGRHRPRMKQVLDWYIEDNLDNDPSRLATDDLPKILIYAEDDITTMTEEFAMQDLINETIRS